MFSSVRRAIRTLKYFKMKKLKIVLAGCLMLAAFFAKAQQGGEQMIDRVIAVVGKHIVKQSELESQYMQYITQPGAEMTTDIRCRMLEELLYQKLLLAQAEKDSIVISDDQVNSEIDRRLRYYIGQFGSQEKFEQFYGKTTEQFRDDLQDDVRNLLKAQTMQSRIAGDISVSPAEVKAFYSSIPQDSLPFINAEVEIGQIIKKAPVSAEMKEYAREKLEGIRNDIMAGKDFGTMANLYSMDPGSNKNGGCYNNIQRGQFVPEWDAMAFSLKPGEVSPVFETVYGYFILKVKQRRGEFVDACSILIIPETTVSDLDKAREQLDSLYTMLQRDSISFSDAAGKFSDDELTKNSGGLMVDPETGSTRIEMSKISQIDPTIVFTIDKMKPGQMTPPSLTQTYDGKQAYRIVYLKSRTEPHRLNLKDDYQLIQNMAIQEKQEKLIDEWIGRRLGSTYVRISDDFRSCRFDNNWVKP
jgi:peptidyl-prolyl cis-trans isomerase SurA